METGIGLGDLITKIKQELKSTDKRSRAFLVEKVELELKVLVSREGSAKFKGQVKSDVKISILSFDLFKVGEVQGGAQISGELGRQDIQTIKLTLTPAILNQELMKNLDTEMRQEIENETEETMIQGDDEDDRF